MANIQKFRFIGFDYDEKNAEATLRYGFDDAHFFDEKIIFFNAKTSFDEKEKQALQKVLFFLHLACGISYYKAFCPSEIQIETGSLNQEQANFFEEFYLKGLGEFAWRNQLRLDIKFPFSEKASISDASKLELSPRIAVPIGGGKDSVVVLESLKAAGKDVVCIAQGRPRPIRECIEASGVDDIDFKRTICPNLLELNQQEGVLNGHIPITGIYAFCLTLGAILYGYDMVAMANERSANVGNLVRDDNFEVNHQWSKSLDFELMFDGFCHQYMLKNFHYFSLLRPLSELDIARRFAKLEKYYPVFTSCNKAFRIDESKRIERWCADCDKCRFVFLALSPFMPKAELIRSVGKNILDDESQAQGFEELLGLSNHKPFECVGELEECVVAFHLLAQNSVWKDDKLVAKLYPQVLQKYGLEKIHKWEKQVFSKSSKHNILKDLESCI